MIETCYTQSFFIEVIKIELTVKNIKQGDHKNQRISKFFGDTEHYNNFFHKKRYVAFFKRSILGKGGHAVVASFGSFSCMYRVI